ncbi:MAG: PD-(D/E)XK nuclease family transposase [Desulfitobacteriaceae bacterium]
MSNDQNDGNPERYVRLDPKNDFLFKKIFSSGGNEDLLIDLLNSILKPPEKRRICQVTILKVAVIRWSSGSCC